MRNQKLRDFQTGKYENYPRCYVCDKPVLNYFSHALTDCDDINGKDFADLMLVLCEKHAKSTENIKTVEEAVEYINKHFPKAKQ